MSTHDILARYYELANAGDWDKWCDLFAEDVVMDEQLAGRVEGLQSLRDMMKGFPALYAQFANVPRRMIIDGGQAAVISHITAMTPGGATIEAEVCNYFQISDGAISYFANFHDTAPFAAVAA
jgi:ketosteroid isomerase-like protein